MSTKKEHDDLARRVTRPAVGRQPAAAADVAEQARVYLASQMGMSDLEDQEHNWIYWHLVSFALFLKLAEARDRTEGCS